MEDKIGILHLSLPEAREIYNTCSDDVKSKLLIHFTIEELTGTNVLSIEKYTR